MGKRKKNLDKKTCEILHAKQRFIERYGLVVTDAELGDMVSQIQKGTAKFIWKDTNNRKLFRVSLRGKEVDVVYDKLRKVIITALPFMNLANGDKE